MALIFLRVPMIFTLSSFEVWACTQTLWQIFPCLVYAERFSQCMWSTRLQTFLTVSTSTLCQGNWKWWLSHQVLAHETSACTVCRCKTIYIRRPHQALNNVSKTLIVKNQTIVVCLQLFDTKTRDTEKNSFIYDKLVHCIFILWVNTQNLTGWKRWVLVEKLTPFDKILR